MPRSNRISHHEFPFHLTGRCINRDWFGQPLAEVWTIFSDHLFFCAKAFQVEIHSFVLMQNHFHLIARFPENNMSKAMAYLMRETSRRITKNAGRINSTYGDRFHSSMISSEIYFRNAYKYNYRNPVTAGICTRVEDYEFSTLTGLMGKVPLYIPLVEDEIFFENPDDVLNWLNESPDPALELEMKVALKKGLMSFGLDKNGRPCTLAQRLL